MITTTFVTHGATANIIVLAWNCLIKLEMNIILSF